MMASKARLFGDTETEQKILETVHPKEQKELGRQVKGFNADIWKQHCKEIVYEGNFLKFTQNKDLNKLLIETAGSTLVECSLFDTIWGNGLAIDDPNVENRAMWRGTNYLGEILTQLRDELIKSGKFFV